MTGYSVTRSGSKQGGNPGSPFIERTGEHRRAGACAQPRDNPTYQLPNLLGMLAGDVSMPISGEEMLKRYLGNGWKVMHRKRDSS